ncbi:putative pyridoxal-dependent decarboxylase domain-containing protein 2 [Actinia tenebrosa]|uniref:Pyridoxal-dependent decarboxylase domain-containing protein 2 n=1 Tax=Actinia tenebrosa TaxID=6105 RepID=A0A6P8ILH5_ACTTE|nr:putative pyridoxal-dependent decarboxylase domain-containing protein 2 [Actinia tenebrosa]
MADEIQQNSPTPPQDTTEKPPNATTNHQETEPNSTQMMYEDVQACVKSVFGKDGIPSETEEHNSDEDTNAKQPLKYADIRSILRGIVNLVNHEKPARIYSYSLDQFTHASVSAQELASYLSLLDQQRIKKLTAFMKSDCTHWLSKLFSFENASACFHGHQWEGLERVCRLALLAKYPKYGTEGFTSLYTRPPVIYVSNACAPGLGQYLCSQLGLPQSSICKVPCNTVFGSPHTLDIAAFERLFNDDVACGKTPLLLVAYAGTPLVGHTDNLGRLRELCTQNGLWLHIEGDNLSALALKSIPPSLKSASSCDSMTLNIAHWFGLPGVPLCTFFRARDPIMAESAGLTRSSSPERLSILPLWTSIKNIGLDKMREMILHAAHLSQQLCLGIDSIPSMRRIAQPHCTSLGVVFRYRASSSSSSNKPEDSPEQSGGDDDQDEPESPQHSSSSENEEIPQSVRDAMNTKLADYLAEAAPNVVLDIIDIPKEGCFLKFTPILSARVTGTTSDHIDDFIISLKKKVASMDSILVAQSAIKTALEDKNHVIMVDSTDPMIAGSLLCFPPYWALKTTEKLSEAKKMELNSLNKEVLQKIAEYHEGVFSLGSTTDGLACINVHQGSHPNMYGDFVELVSKTCVELADSSKFLEQMQDMVRKGIEAAEEDLHKDAEDKLLEEGVIRLVPIVGSLYNWWSPPPKDSGVKGRSFNLSSGHLETTDKIYKYHMQVQEEETAATPPNSPNPKSSLKTTPKEEVPQDDES